MKLRSKPSIREKKRYIAFRLHSEAPINYADMKNSVWNSILGFVGESDAGRANINIVKNAWNQKQQTGLVRCSHIYVDKVKMSLALISQIGDNRVIFQTLWVSGTIEGTQKAGTAFIKG